MGKESGKRRNLQRGYFDDIFQWEFAILKLGIMRVQRRNSIDRNGYVYVIDSNGFIVICIQIGKLK